MTTTNPTSNFEPETLNPHVSPSPPPPLSASFNPDRAPSPSDGRATASRRWQPNSNDHLIFDWVKMQGKTQGEVASLLSIHQGTVSRVIQRYERWMAHRKGRENGRLDPQERLRAQRQLTYDRNELILASCLRIAQDMEGSLDGSRSVITRPMSNYTQEKEIRTTHFTTDRTGSVCRFLRLAFRINMEQEKLTDRMAKDDQVPAEPLNDQELADQAHQAALDADEMANSKALRPLPDEPVGWDNPVGWDEVEGTAAERWSTTDGPPHDLVTREKPGDAPTQGSSLGDPPATPATQSDPIDLSPTLNSEPETLNSRPQTPGPGAHNAHISDPPQIAATASKSCTCVVELGPKKIVHARIADPDQSDPIASATSSSALRPLAAVT